MKKIMTAFAAMTLVLGASACTEVDETAASAEAGSINGEWLIDVDSASFENDNRDFVLADGKFDCNSCIPPYSTTANGEWQSVDRPGVDSVKVEVVDDNTVKIASRLGDKDLGNSTWTVSADGKTANTTFTDLSGDEPVNGSGSFTRTAAGPEGSHAMSGKWSSNGVDNVNEAGLKFSVNVDGDQYSSSGNGSSFTATLGGEPVAIEGSNSNVMVAVERIGDNGFRETYSRDGEELSVNEITVSGDRLSAVSTDSRDGSVVRYSARRQ